LSPTFCAGGGALACIAGRAGICRMIRIVTTTPIARMPPNTATKGPNAAAPDAGRFAALAPVAAVDAADALVLEAAVIDETDGDVGDAPGASGGTVALPALSAARSSPHSTQKRAPVMTDAPHCGQNRTVNSEPSQGRRSRSSNVICELRAEPAHTNKSRHRGAAIESSENNPSPPPAPAGGMRGLSVGVEGCRQIQDGLVTCEPSASRRNPSR
jgi:hypothetical protein